MKTVFDEAANPSRIETDSERIDRIAFELGMGGDGADLANAGLMAKSNAALANLADTLKRKEKEERFHALVREIVLEALRNVSAELDWLDEQIEFELRVIEAHQSDIDFIRSLDENDVLGPDGRPSAEVRALLEKHDKTLPDDASASEVMMLLQVVETELHTDIIDRTERVKDYRERHRELRDRVREIETEYGSGLPQDIKSQLRAVYEREPPEIVDRAEMQDNLSEDVADTIEEVARSNRLSFETTGFVPPSL